MDVWPLPELDMRAHEPRILRSDDGAARGVALLLPSGERLQEHQTHEHTWLVVAHGAVEIREGARCVQARAGAVVHFAPAERREVDALEDSRLLMVFAPWPGPGHASH